ncbi:MAG: hypothetical protein GY847_06385 [Proteobacteria bacterium]|nr:hypothetical protein [Pseudomonadota bacterium]
MASTAKPIVILTAACVALLALAAMAGFSSMSFSSWLWFVMLSSVGCGLLVYAAFWFLRAEDLTRSWLLAVLASGILMRIVAAGADHMLCDDAARYHWDGKLIAYGTNPYEYTPYVGNLLRDMQIDKEYIDLPTTPLDKRINHSDVRSPYPPLAELFFAAAYLLSPDGLTGFHVLCLLAELITWMLLAWYLGARGQPRVCLLLAVWSPLLITEGYLPGHVDLLGLPFMTLFLISIDQKRPLTAGLSLAAVCLIKPIGLFLVPAAIREIGLKRSLAMGTAAAALTAVFYAPLIAAGTHHFLPMQKMALTWSCNGTIAALLDAMLPRDISRLASTVLLVSLIVIGTWLGKDFLSRCLLAMAAFLAVSPVIFPWYMAWMVPLIVLRPDPALIALLLLMPLTNVVQEDLFLLGVWDPPSWSTAAAFVPFYLLIMIGARRKWGMFRHPK